MKVKVNIKEVARTLAHNKVLDLYGKDALYENNYIEYSGYKYKEQVKKDFDTYYHKYLDNIMGYIVYPFKEGETYYTIEENEVVESCWDDISEIMYRRNPEKRLFKSETQAIFYLQENK